MLSIEDLRRRYYAEPFEPFDLILEDGQRVPVMQPELYGFAEENRLVSVHQPDGRLQLVRRDRVSKIEPHVSHAGEAA